jgi:DNA-directed RNA polymerase specialized sigma24 family protein
MARLDQADWVLLTLRYADGWDVTEIAHARGLSVPAISTQIKKALQRLHRELSRIR